MGPDEHNNAEALVMSLPGRTLEEVRERMAEAVSCQAQELDYDTYDAWFCRPLPGIGIAPGIIGSVYAVSSKIGNDPLSLAVQVERPALDVLGIE